MRHETAATRCRLTLFGGPRRALEREVGPVLIVLERGLESMDQVEDPLQSLVPLDKVLFEVHILYSYSVIAICV